MDNSQNYLRVTQFVRPHGERRAVYSPVGAEYVKRARSMKFSAEILPDGRVVLYGRFLDEKPENELIGLAENGPGENNPTATLIRMIEKLEKRRVK